MMNQLPSLTVQRCIELGYFQLSNNVVSTLKQFPYPVKCIRDFKKIFCDDIRNGDYTIKHKVFKNSDLTHLTTEQQTDILKIYTENKLVNRNLSDFAGRLYNCPDVDLIVNRGGLESDYDRAYDWDAHGDCFSGSTFNSVKIISDRGNISSLNNLFRRCNCKKIEIEGFCRPSDMAGMCEFNSALTSFPNTIDYSRCTNIGYAWEWCNNLQEIPSHNTVTDDSNRVTDSKNIINVGFCDQAFNICRNLRKIGPVLNFYDIVPNSTQKLPYNMFNDSLNISDVRFKNLCNGDWDFRRNDYRGLPNLNKDSIKYILANLGNQQEKDWCIGEVYEGNIGEVLMGATPTINNTYCYGTDPLFGYTKINTNKILIEAEDENVRLDLFGLYFRNNDEYDWVITEKPNITPGQEYTKTNEQTTHFALYVYRQGSIDLSAIKIYKFDSDGNRIRVNHDLKHNIYFSENVISADTAKTEFATEIQSANNKGWTVYFGDTEITL